MSLYAVGNDTLADKEHRYECMRPCLMAVAYGCVSFVEGQIGTVGTVP